LPSGDVRLQEARILYESPGRPNSGIEIALSLYEQRLEFLEVGTWFAISDFLRSALVSAGSDMPKLGDVGRASRARDNIRSTMPRPLLMTFTGSSITMSGSSLSR
jgi:hypothetical protein